MAFYDMVGWVARSVEHPYRRTIKHSDGSTEQVEIYTDKTTQSDGSQKDPGEVGEEGTPVSATNLNTMEGGILHALIMVAQYGSVLKDVLQQIADARDEYVDVTLSGTAYPGLGTAVGVKFGKMRNNTNYKLSYEVLDTDGTVDDVVFSSKALNGVNAQLRGHCTTATVRVFITGGIY